MITRFDEKNCNPQCSDCNVDLGGNLKVYRQRLIEKYNESTVELLEVKGRRGGRVSTHELSNIVRHYEEKIKKLDVT